jgi:hypothetical protein
MLVRVSQPERLIDLLTHLRRNGYAAETVSDSTVRLPDEMPLGLDVPSW